MRRHELKLPDLAVEGPITVSLWLVPPGGRVSEDEPVVEILAGSVVVDLPAPASGRLAEVLVGEDDPVAAGQLLAVIESDEFELSPDCSQAAWIGRRLPNTNPKRKRGQLLMQPSLALRVGAGS